MTDIVKRLYYIAVHGNQEDAIAAMEAAAAEIKRLRAALEEIDFHGGPAGAVARQVLGTYQYVREKP